MKIYYILLVLLIPVALLFSGCVTNNTPIKIGVVVPLTGDFSIYGQSGKGAIELAAENINYKINNKTIEFIYEDSKCNAKDATEAFNKLINVDKVDYIIGGECSSETLAGAPITENAKIVQITPCSTSPSVRNAGDYIFAVYPLDDFEGTFNAEYIYNTLGIKKVATLTGLSDWPVGLNKSFEKRFKELGGEIVLSETNEQNAKDLKTQLTKIKNSNAELLYSVEYTEAAENLLLQSKEIDLNIPKYMPGIINDDVINVVGSNAENVYTTRPNSKLNDESFTAKLKQKTGLSTVDVSICGGFAYDSLLILKKAIENANSFENEKVKDALYNVKLEGIMGYHEFDKDGVPATGDYKVLKVINSKLVEQ